MSLSALLWSAARVIRSLPRRTLEAVKEIWEMPFASCSSVVAREALRARAPAWTCTVSASPHSSSIAGQALTFTLWTWP